MWWVFFGLFFSVVSVTAFVRFYRCKDLENWEGEIAITRSTRLRLVYVAVGGSFSMTDNVYVSVLLLVIFDIHASSLEWVSWEQDSGNVYL